MNTAKIYIRIEELLCVSLLILRAPLPPVLDEGYREIGTSHSVLSFRNLLPCLDILFCLLFGQTVLLLHL